MTRTTTIGLGIVAIIVTVCSTAFAIDLGNIMPLGDSITRGTAPTVPAGYRPRLYDDLTNAGYTFTFVGTQDGTATGDYTAALVAAGQQHHEGHGSYTIENIDANLASYLSAIPTPKYVLLMIGTNDFIGDPNVESNAINKLDALIGHITASLPNAHLIVSNLTVRGEAAEESHIQTLFNPFVPDLVDAHAAKGEHVTFVDMHSVLTVSDLAPGDNCHPNQAGFDKLGDAWFGAITAVPEPSAFACWPSACSVCWPTRRGSGVSRKVIYCAYRRWRSDASFRPVRRAGRGDKLLRGHHRLELQFRHVVGQPLPHDPAGGQRGAGGRQRLCPRGNVSRNRNGGTLRHVRRSPITFQPYQNEQVTITGLDQLNGGWTQYSGSIWQNGNVTAASQVFLGGHVMTEARSTNSGYNNPLRRTYSTVDSATNPASGLSTITSSALNGTPDGTWNGAKLAFLGGPEYGTSSATIVSQVGNTISYQSPGELIITPNPGPATASTSTAAWPRSTRPRSGTTMPRPRSSTFRPPTAFLPTARTSRSARDNMASTSAASRTSTSAALSCKPPPINVAGNHNLINNCQILYPCPYTDTQL